MELNIVLITTLPCPKREICKFEASAFQYRWTCDYLNRHLVFNTLEASITMVWVISNVSGILLRLRLADDSIAGKYIHILSIGLPVGHNRNNSTSFDDTPSCLVIFLMYFMFFWESFRSSCSTYVHE